MKNKRRLFLSLFIVVTFVIILLGLFIYFDYSNNAIFNRTIKSYSIDEFKSFDSIKVIEVDNEYIKSNDGDMIVLSAAENHFYFSGLPFIEKTEHDTTFALAVGKYLVNQLKSGVSPENLTIG